MKQELEKITGTMMGLYPEMPYDRAERKASEMGKGIVFMVLGAFFILLGFGLAIVPFLILKTPPGVWLLALAAVAAIPGAYCLLAGGNLISRDAMEAAERSGGFLTRTVSRVLRPVRKA